jgi:hypothetical protein
VRIVSKSPFDIQKTETVSQHFVAEGKRSADFQRHTTVAH